MAELSLAIDSVKHLIFDSDDEKNDTELSKLFDSCLRLRELMEDSSLPSNDNELQEGVHVCIKGLEKCTFMVNELGLFSSNETADELQTSSIKYLILPAALGCLNLTVQSIDLLERKEYVEKAEIYFRDFLFRCANYELCETSLRYFKEILDCETSEKRPDPQSLREQKIQQYKRKKELEEKEKALKPALEKPECEEAIREYYFVLLEKWILISIEELENSKREKDILKNFPLNEMPRDDKHNRKADTKPLKPFIITKNEIQKKVFGLGYPSVPVMTIDDFYRQRFEKMVEEHKQNTTGQSLQDAALSGRGLDKETEDIQKEELLDKDDPTELKRARQWDDWKDDNPRGSGNRMNKG
ncbi:Immunoglobulin-binding protein 1 like protein [Argiope bruennichi]|uniref:Immunoglobulin-binding protein 1 like protein n=1 Tax=Argiope bruennichi TaxID=94029 RepID=A0A8T0FAR4_ARGBR|nr:Immunoglobulin-binding protein 1 like protein [Argiope bruennichi]